MMPNLTTAVAVVAVFSAFFLAHEPPKDAMTPLPQQQQQRRDVAAAEVCEGQAHEWQGDVLVCHRERP